MKQDIHPEDYRLVVFKDVSCDYSFLTKSTVQTKDTVKWEDGNEYPLYKLEISNKSHPFYTGKMKFVDTAGRVDKFFAKYGGKKDAPAKEEAESVAEAITEEAPAAEATSEEVSVAEATTKEAPQEAEPVVEENKEEKTSEE
ncbi:MAG: type B 50S ribosomal protein L31 [Bacteroidia bacterium]|nr:type B 50S ribosomal protein L31 [Bacteroidia bacterium]